MRDAGVWRGGQNTHHNAARQKQSAFDTCRAVHWQKAQKSCLRTEQACAAPHWCQAGKNVLPPSLLSAPPGVREAEQTTDAWPAARGSWRAELTATGIFITDQRVFYYLRVTRKGMGLALMSFGCRGSKGQM